MSIPRAIHQIWCGFSPIPEREKEWCEQMRRMNPEWRHTLYGNDLLDRYRDDIYVQHMLSKGEKWAYLTDRLRILLLRDEGGVYLDVDCQPIRPLSTLPIWDDPKIDFVTALRSPHRKEVALHRGVSLVDNTFLASAKGGRMVTRLEALWTPASVTGEAVVNGNRVGIAILENASYDTTLLNFRYIYAHESFPETIALHDYHNLGSWRPEYKPA